MKCDKQSRPKRGNGQNEEKKTKLLRMFVVLAATADGGRRTKSPNKRNRMQFTPATCNVDEKFFTITTTIIKLIYSKKKIDSFTIVADDFAELNICV